MNQLLRKPQLLTSTLSRRALLKLGLVSAAGLSVVKVYAQDEQLQATPACDDGDEPTPPQTEGPFYTPDTPERTSLLEEGMFGTRLLVVGKVLGTDCQPVAGALLDFWHADDAGQYDNVGYRLRGHQFSNEAGEFQLETIVPGLYAGRTRHIHVKVQKPYGDILTSQLYFPDEPDNARDRIFDPALVMEVSDRADDGKRAFFNFVLS
jgi:protocatechuate 3,4-dioxygenase beta subunit